MVGSQLWLLGFEGSTTVGCFGLSASLWRYSGVLSFSAWAHGGGG